MYHVQYTTDPTIAVRKPSEIHFLVNPQMVNGSLIFGLTHVSGQALFISCTVQTRIVLALFGVDVMPTERTYIILSFNTF